MYAGSGGMPMASGDPAPARPLRDMARGAPLAAMAGVWLWLVLLLAMLRRCDCTAR